MNVRKTRDPQVDPSREDKERVLAQALVALWDSETVAGIAAAISTSIVNAEAFGNRHGVSVAFDDAARLREVLTFLWKTEESRVFLTQSPG